MYLIIAGTAVIFIDESGVNLAMVRLYARSLKGSRALVTKTE
jgi:hypothetical protein